MRVKRAQTYTLFPTTPNLSTTQHTKHSYPQDHQHPVNNSNNTTIHARRIISPHTPP